MNHDKEFDASGLACPMPIVKTKKALNDMSSGQVLRVVATAAIPAAKFHAAAATLTEHLLFLSEAAIIINSCNIVPQADSAFNAMNYAVLSLQTGNAAAGSLATALGARSTQVTSLVTNTATAVASGLNAAVAANQRVVLNVTKGGTGVAVNILLVEVTYQLA